MIRVHIFCEGQTEETFVRELLANHFAQLNIWINPIILRTSKIGKGGLSTYGKLRNQVERKCKEDPNAWVTLMIHEFESLLFSEPEAFENWCDDPQVVFNLTKIRCGFESPEHINDGYTTAPSKRIISIFSQYDKILHGSLVALGIGLETIRRECSMFNSWIERLESLV